MGLVRLAVRIGPPVLQQTGLAVPVHIALKIGAVDVRRNRAAVKRCRVVLAIQALHAHAVHSLRNTRGLLLIDRVVRISIHVRVIRMSTTAVLSLTQDNVPHVLMQYFDSKLFTELMRNKHFGGPQIYVAFAFTRIALGNLMRITGLIHIMRINFVTNNRHFRATVLKHNAAHNKGGLPALQRTSADAAGVGTSALRLTWETLVTIMMGQVRGIADLAFNNDRTRGLQRLRRASGELALHVQMSLTGGLMDLPFFHPVIRPTEDRALRHTGTDNLAKLILAFHAQVGRAVRPTDAPLNRHVDIGRRRMLIRIRHLERTGTTAAASARRDLGPPSHRRSRQADRVLTVRFKGTHVRRTPPSVAHGPGTRTHYLFH